MKNIYKTSENIWRVQVCLDGKRMSASFDNLADCETFLKTIKSVKRKKKLKEVILKIKEENKDG